MKGKYININKANDNAYMLNFNLSISPSDILAYLKRFQKDAEIYFRITDKNK